MVICPIGMRGCTCHTSSINHFLHWLMMLIQKMLIMMMWCLCFSFLIFTLHFDILNKNKSSSVNMPTPKTQWMTFVVIIIIQVNAFYHTEFSFFFCIQWLTAVPCMWACVCMRPQMCICFCLCVCVFHNTNTKFQKHVVQVIWSKKSSKILFWHPIKVCTSLM
jgi:hypothetical protein